MAYPSRFLRLVVSGRLYGGAEHFSFGVNFAPDFPGDAPTEVPEAVVTATTAYFQTSKVAHSNAAIETIKLNEIGTDGRYTSNADTVQYDYATPAAGMTSVWQPPQVALAITLGTDKQRGRASRGRYYLPTGVTIGAGGVVPLADMQSQATAARTWLDALDAALPGWHPAVMSNIGEGASEFVTHVRVGAVLDTIRSRRRNIPEAYHDSARLANIPTTT